MRLLKLTTAALIAASAIGLLASCQPKPGGETPSATRADSLKMTQDSVRTAAAAERGGRAFLSHCAMCHGNGGNGDGEVAAAIKASKNVTVARLNDAETMDRLTREQLVEVIQKGGAHTGRSGIMPAWGDSLDAAMISDIADFVQTLKTANPAVPRATLAAYLMAPTGVPADGRELFVHHCVACHGDAGKGDGPYGQRLVRERNVHPRDLTDSKYFENKLDRDIYSVIALGGGHFHKAVYMPTWTVNLTPAQMKSIVAYVRSLSKTTPKP